MSIRLPEAEENPKRTILEEMAMWKSSLLSVALHVFVIGGLAKAAMEMPTPSSSAPPVHQTQKIQHRKVGDILAELDDVQEKISEVGEAKSRRMDELMDVYLDPSRPEHANEIPPIDVYLELDAYDSVAHWLKHIPVEESAKKDWKVELEKRKNAWLKRYEKSLQKVIEADLPWTGDVEKDFPLLQKVLYLEGEAFFAQDERPVRYAFEANTASEQLELGQVNCTSSRFTPWVLRAIYESRHIPTDQLKNLKTIEWKDHIASFYDDGSGVQLQEMDTETPLRTGRLSHETKNEGKVGNAQNHLADYLMHTSGLKASQALRLDALGYGTPALKYAVKEPPALAALAHQEKTNIEPKNNYTVADFRDDSLSATVSQQRFFRGITVGKGNTLLEPPDWLKNPRMHEAVIKNMRLESGKQRNYYDVNGVTLAAFGDLELFSPDDAETLVDELQQNYPGGLENLLNYFLRNDSYKIPHTLLERMAQDPATLKYFALEVQSELDDQGGAGWDGAWPAKHLLMLVKQFKSARSTALLLDSKTILPELNIPVDTEEALKVKIFNIEREGLKAEMDLDISSEEFDFKNLEVDWKKVFEKYQNSPEKLKSVLGKSPELRGNLGPIILSNQSEALRNFLKPFYLEDFYQNSRIDVVTEEPLASWVKEMLTKRRNEGTISDMDLYYSGWGSLIPAGQENLNPDEYFGRKYGASLGQNSEEEPSKEFIERIQELYMNSETSERVKLLGQLASRNFFILPGEGLYPEDREWIMRDDGKEANLLRFHYAKNYKVSALKDSELEELQGIDQRNIKWAGTPWDRLADVWDEVSKRTHN